MTIHFLGNDFVYIKQVADKWALRTRHIYHRNTELQLSVNSIFGVVHFVQMSNGSAVSWREQVAFDDLLMVSSLKVTGSDFVFPCFPLLYQNKTENCIPVWKILNMYSYRPVKAWSQWTIHTDYFPLKELFIDVTRASMYTGKPNSW